MRQLDLYLFHLVNGWAGARPLDQLVAFAERHLLFRALPLLPYWWLWFAGAGEARERRRRLIVGALLGTAAALLLARGLALALPFRPRPLYALGAGYRPPGLEIPRAMEDWSAFPSDTAALFFGLSFGLWRLSRPLGAAVAAYSALWVCLPRVYLGIHYPSDILAGALLGIAMVWTATRAAEARGGALGRHAVAPLSTLEARRPGPFYAAAFAVAFETATLFDGARAVGRAGLHWLRAAGHAAGWAPVALLLAGALLALAGLAAHRQGRLARRC